MGDYRLYRDYQAANRLSARSPSARSNPVTLLLRIIRPSNLAYHPLPPTIGLTWCTRLLDQYINRPRLRTSEHNPQLQNGLLLMTLNSAYFISRGTR